jgi:hypothetical protein
VMQRGGFDVVLGNPPWEVMQLEQVDYFAARLPAISLLSGDERKKAVAALEKKNPEMFREYEAEKRLADAGREFTRESGRFPLGAHGKVNTYAVFSELARSLSSRPLSRFGLIVPTGIATDATTAKLFAEMISSHEIVLFADFENRNGIFPAVHRTYRFSILAGGKNSISSKFYFFLNDVSQLSDPERRSVLSEEDINWINPNTKTAPVFRTRSEAEIVKRIHLKVPVFINDSNDQHGNPWGADFRQGLFDMFYDSGFRTAAQLNKDGYVRSGQDWIFPDGENPPAREVEARGKKVHVSSGKYVPLFEAKMFDLYNHRSADYSTRGSERGHRVLPELSPDDLHNAEREAEPFYWVPETVLAERAAPRAALIGYGEATTAITQRTCIVTIIPFAGVGHKEILIFTERSESEVVCLVANCNSLVLDFVARTKVSYINFGRFIFKQLPLFPPDFYSEQRKQFVVPRVLQLTYTSRSLEAFARNLGYYGPPVVWDEDRRASLRADLDAFYARAYGLTRDELRYILDPADLKGPDYPSETFRVLKENEIRQHGEYQTRRLVLEAWDRMEQDGTFGALGMADATSVAVQPIQLPQLGQFPNAVWAWPQGINERDRVRAQLRAVVGILPEASDVRRVRLAALACLQPGLLDDFLSEADRREWQRLMAHSAGLAQLVPPTNAAWGAAFNELVSSAVLDVSTDGTRWGAGPRLDRTTLNASDPTVGRALFVWSRLEAVTLDQGLARVSAEILPFIREGRLAA